MSDWQKGDLALCVKTSPWAFYADSGKVWETSGPPAGRFLKVRGVEYGPNGRVSLKFSDYPDPPEPRSRGYLSDRFRKVTPKKPDIYDQGIIALMNKEPNHVDR